MTWMTGNLHLREHYLSVIQDWPSLYSVSAPQLLQQFKRAEDKHTLGGSVI